MPPCHEDEGGENIQGPLRQPWEVGDIEHKNKQNHDESHHKSCPEWAPLREISDLLNLLHFEFFL